LLCPLLGCTFTLCSGSGAVAIGIMKGKLAFWQMFGRLGFFARVTSFITSLAMMTLRIRTIERIRSAFAMELVAFIQLFTALLVDVMVFT
jgi:hypothetical protein